MPDHAVSAHPAVQAQLDRLAHLSSGIDILGLERITALLTRLGDPHLRLPPVLHVAGTNGKGSTCAFLRAAIEAEGLTCHVYTSPHLVRFNERIRLAGRLIENEPLAALLAEVLDAGGDIGASFFEVTTAAAFLAFARAPADACVVEVGLGGRLDATNVVRPVATGIAQLGIDHQAFLGDTLIAIAGEKAGIAKPGVPLVTMRYPPEIAERVRDVAGAASATVLAEGDAWRFRANGRVILADAAGELTLPRPALPGAHQAGNLALAAAMLRAQQAIPAPQTALAAAATGARWPARMQRLAPGPLTALLPPGTDTWLDGGHNGAAAGAVAAALAALPPRPLHLVLGMLANKDAAALLEPVAPLAKSLIAVPVPGHEHHPPLELARLGHSLGAEATGTAIDIVEALKTVARVIERDPSPNRVAILGSLYLAGEVLHGNGEPPD